MKKLTKWDMIKEAMEHSNGPTTYSDIKHFIVNKWGDINKRTIEAEIIGLIVNHNSRIHYGINKKPRLTNTDSPYDFLYEIKRGVVEKYSIERHGLWEIYEDEHKILKVRIIYKPKIFTPFDITWVKNVSNTEIGVAYLDIGGNEFILDYPAKHTGNILSTAINEMILIHQKINNIRYFTHLVTPIDNLIREGDRPRYPNGRKVRIIAQADLNIPINSTLWDTINFAGISQGNACRVDNITNIKNTEEFQLDVWERFRPYFVAYDQISISTTLAVISELQNTIPDLIVTEGGLKLVSHIVKERNGKIVAAKKQQAIENNLLFCEVCEFSFPKIYQSNFIECHHLTPIGQHGERETTLDDLSLVCSNCHRMLHKKFNENYFSIQELKDHIKICANKLI